ncbi:ABC transporter ATP-binding protein [Haloglomus litoreum]|uniref:ABC transporter ATP-binding protein n=1 Tax=Haloglomus litoreum TaxID=3034026 RepID=UPI0023E85113|nr:ABC transporter ATP-binding protein [Haloglomus sp. DT116]
MSLFEASGVGKRFAGLQALDDVSVSIDEGELVGLIGPNGAGKSTFFNVVTGVRRPDEGSVRFDGADITGLRPASIARRGMVRTFQMSRELGAMTVEENLALGASNHPGETVSGALVRTQAVRERERETLERVAELVDFLELSELADEYASKLSGGQRKLLALGRVLMSDPELILLDEPFAGVNPTLERKLVERIVELNEDGMTFLIVEHEIETLVEVCDRLVVLHNGRVLTEGEPEAVVSDDEVIDAYLGDTLQST